MSRAEGAHFGVALLPGDDQRAAQLPLFDEGLIDAIEITVEHAHPEHEPAWFSALADHYAAAGRCYAHGVEYSPCSMAPDERHARWIASARAVCRRRGYVHLTEHYGGSTVPGLARGAPLPTLRSRGAIEGVVDRLRRLEDAVELPIGLENLALAWSADDAFAQADFLGEVLERTRGFLLLDAHNLHCQVRNFGVDPLEWLARVSFERVREVHVSGGSEHAVARPSDATFRRDTHDDDVPDDVFALAEAILARASRVELVVFERLPGTAIDLARYRADARRLHALVHRAHAPRERPSAPPRAPAPEVPLDELVALQAAVVAALAEGDTPEVLRARVRDVVANRHARAWIDGADPRALEVASLLVRTWSTYDDPRRPRVEG